MHALALSCTGNLACAPMHRRSDPFQSEDLRLAWLPCCLLQKQDYGTERRPGLLSQSTLTCHGQIFQSYSAFFEDLTSEHFLAGQASYSRFYIFLLPSIPKFALSTFSLCDHSHVEFSESYLSFFTEKWSKHVSASYQPKFLPRSQGEKDTMLTP